MANRHHSLSLDFDEPELHQAIEVAAARKGVSPNVYCLEAVRNRLAKEGLLPQTDVKHRQEAARALDQLREQIGPIGISVRDLIEEGRRR
ncbi:MAG TPA: hypothetical protein VF756_07455 [Thermoanaerobaculia bacterium]